MQPTSEEAGRIESTPPGTEAGPAQRAVTARARRWTWGSSTPEPSPASRPTFGHFRELLGRGEYAAAVRLAYRTAFDATVQAYGLTVPPFVTDRQFLQEFLRPDMGPLYQLLPELYRFYEPVKFGKLENGDRDAVQAVLDRLSSETVLGKIDDPRYRSGSTPPVQHPVPDPTAPIPPSRTKEGE